LSANKVKILVLGQSGMLGHMVVRVLEGSTKLEVFSTQISCRNKPGYLNALEGRRGLLRIFKKYGSFDYCINCIGLLNDKISADNPSSVRRTRLVNSLFPKYLAKVAGEYGCKIIHISTDGVFQGTKPAYYEDSHPDCKDVYGRTKLSGEVTADNFLTIRCSIIGPSPYEGGGLWEWFSGLARGAQVKGFTNHIWNGITTLQFGQLCKAIIINDYFSILRSRSAVYHFAPNRPLSKFALLKVLKNSLRKDIKVSKATQGPVKVSRILRSRYRFLRKLLPYGLDMQQAVTQLINYERKKTWLRKS